MGLSRQLVGVQRSLMTRPLTPAPAVRRRSSQSRSARSWPEAGLIPKDGGRCQRERRTRDRSGADSGADTELRPRIDSGVRGRITSRSQPVAAARAHPRPAVPSRLCRRDAAAGGRVHPHRRQRHHHRRSCRCARRWRGSARPRSASSAPAIFVGHARGHLDARRHRAAGRAYPGLRGLCGHRGGRGAGVAAFVSPWGWVVYARHLRLLLRRALRHRRGLGVGRRPATPIAGACWRSTMSCISRARRRASRCCASPIRGPSRCSRPRRRS